MIIGFSKPKNGISPLSTVIRFIENTEFSHVYIRFYSTKYNRWLIYHASGFSVHFLNYKDFLEKVTIIDEFVVDVPNDVECEIIGRAIDLVGKPYGFTQLVNLLLFKLFNYNITDLNKGYVCSELIAELYPEIAKNIHKDINLITPKDIHNYLKTINN